LTMKFDSEEKHVTAFQEVSIDIEVPVLVLVLALQLPFVVEVPFVLQLSFLPLFLGLKGATLFT